MTDTSMAMLLEEGEEYEKRMTSLVNPAIEATLPDDEYDDEANEKDRLSMYIKSTPIPFWFWIVLGIVSTMLIMTLLR